DKPRCAYEHLRVSAAPRSCRDLQFIRINGTLVGGLVGMTLHFITTVL
ncbi:MAG: DUF445 family protein, partial [Erythrobacter sp.]|nr:DUF445 family protein [Erythrobacter sp.]